MILLAWEMMAIEHLLDGELYLLILKYYLSSCENTLKKFIFFTQMSNELELKWYHTVTVFYSIKLTLKHYLNNFSVWKMPRKHKDFILITQKVTLESHQSSNKSHRFYFKDNGKYLVFWLIEQIPTELMLYTQHSSRHWENISEKRKQKLESLHLLVGVNDICCFQC